MAVGVERLSVDPGTLVLPIEALCEARGLDAHNFVHRLHCHQRSLVGPLEDVVTLGVNAAAPIVGAQERARIGLLIVATESAVDQEKPLSTWMHRFLELRPDCRNFEVKHACYGATAAMRMAQAWLLTQPESAQALVVSTDHALLGIEGPQEPVLGAGAAAVLLSHRPRLWAFEGTTAGVFTHEIADIFRPAPGVETGDADDSLLSYLDGVEATFGAYEAACGHPVDLEADFDANVYHVPFGGLAERAHLRLARARLGLSRSEAMAHWERRAAGSLRFNRRMGGVYGAATLVAMLGLVASTPALQPEQRVGVYAYGSGSCAEFYRVRLAQDMRAVVQEVGLQAKLDARRAVDVPTYEACERHLHRSLCAQHFEPDVDLVPGLLTEHYAGRKRLVLRGIRDYRREYAWS
jgi:3-hydroxy-3-methylglutaryl CoA synthase